MGYKELERDLKFIKNTMEKSARYKNVPASGYLAAGVLGLAGPVLTWLLLGIEKLRDLSLLESVDVRNLAILWSLVFVLAVAAVVFLIRLNAKKHRLTAWNSLSARMFVSQIPLFLVAGLLVVALMFSGAFDLVPAVWLLCYSLVAFSFAYFTGPDHTIQGIIFFLLGAVAAFSPATVSLILLAAGFGGMHIIFGIYRLARPTLK
ncbi:MAG: hypothetical protein ACYS8W_03755 [Planctomycetota bacterium]|jgi:hypothetical protein